MEPTGVVAEPVISDASARERCSDASIGDYYRENGERYEADDEEKQHE